jgi:hypothetical protein
MPYLCKICNKQGMEVRSRGSIHTWWYEYDSDSFISHDCPCHKKQICPDCHYKYREECTKSSVIKIPELASMNDIIYWKYPYYNGRAYERWDS